MNALSLWAGDSATMLRRNLKHMLRYPSMTLMLVGIPVVFLLLFVYVFGDVLGDGLGGGTGGRAGYVEYITPGILLMTVAGVAQGTAISVAMDVSGGLGATGGIVSRFRTMAISRASVLTGHVLGAVIRTMLAVAVVLGVAVLIGFRPDAGFAGWVAAIGVLAMISFAITWLCVALGMVADGVETASNLPLPLVFLPFLGSGFVPTDSMATGVRWFAEYQPFTPIIETVRGLLLGTEVGNSAILAVAWCAAISLVGFLWALALFNRDPAR